MQAKRPHLSSNHAGNAVLAVLFTIALLSFLIGTIASVTNTHIAVSRRTVDRAVAVAYGDGVMESLYDQWRQAMINVTAPEDRSGGLSTSALAAKLQAPSSAVLPPPPGISLSGWSVTACTPMLAPTTDPTGRPVPENGTLSKLRVSLHYLARATVQFRNSTGNSVVVVERVFSRTGRNLFDNYYFGTQGNSEFHPGAEMYVNGTVYSGGNLFTAHDTLHFLKDVTFTGSHTINYRTEDSRYGTAPTILTGGLGNNWDLNNPPHRGDEQKLFDTTISNLDPNFIDDPSSNDVDSDGNRNNDGFRELIEEPVPVTDPAKPDPLQLDSTTSERLSQNADYRIYVDANNVVSVFKGNATTPLPAGNPEYTALTGALTTNTALRDVRDGDNVRVVTVDVGKVTTAANATTLKDSVGDGDGLLLYIVDKSNGTSVPSKVVNSATGATTNVTSSRSRGVKLVKGAKLPDVGLTVASPNTVYIQGDYNTGTSGTTKPPSNTASSYTPPVDSPSPVVSGYERKASAVVGDAVNILSNSWNDANSLLGQSSRRATNTTVNTAVVAGNVPTTASSYSGGIENFARFHEDWGSVYYTNYGALALLYDSAQATRPWSAADYTPPSRRWYYDPLLQDTNPPGFRVARVYKRGRWTQR